MEIQVLIAINQKNDAMGKIEKYYSEFQAAQVRTYKTLSVDLHDEICMFEIYFDLQQRLFYNHFPGVLDTSYDLEEYERIVIQSYLKSTHLILTVNQLILHGDYGSARILMRQIFEYLIIGKYVHAKKDNITAEKWLNERHFDVYDNIIKLLRVPDKKNFHEFWKLLSNQAHARTNSFQIGLSDEMTFSDVVSSYRINLILLCCKNSLLNDNFINTKLKYRSEKYGFKKEENKEIRQQIRISESDMLRLFSDSGIAIIKDFKTKWELKK